MALTVHFEDKGVLMAFLLDIIEVTELHLGENLAAAFAAALKDLWYIR